MNDNQIEIVDTISIIFANLPSYKEKDVRRLIQERFNRLEAPDHEWSDIEDHVLGIIQKLKLVSP